MATASTTAAPALTALGFFKLLKWINGHPLLSTIELYRRRLFESFNAVGRDGQPRYNLGLFGRAKKNWKTADAMLEALYAVMQDSPWGSQVYVLANDEKQAGDDLALTKKLVNVNPVLGDWLRVQKNIIERRDGAGFIEILPAQDAIGAHGKTFRLLVIDEIHGYRNWDVLEALAPDPTRLDAQTWVTSYASLFHRPGVPLFDLLALAKSGGDPRMLTSWYAADWCTDPDFASRSPEERANPSIESWRNPSYLAQQRRRLPSHKFRRLHLNLPGVPEGSAYQPEPVMSAVDRGVRVRPRVDGVSYAAFVDMSGGSSDDAVLGIAHRDADARGVLDRLVDQGARPPFDPGAAVTRFVAVLKEYGCASVTGDRYAGETFRSMFENAGIRYSVSAETKSELYEALEPILNGGRAVLLDEAQLEQQLLGLVWRGGKIDHPAGEHDDFANAAAGAVVRAAKACTYGGEISSGDVDWSAYNDARDFRAPFGRERF
jgi:hypothetical protein